MPPGVPTLRCLRFGVHTGYPLTERHPFAVGHGIPLVRFHRFHTQGLFPSGRLGLMSPRLRRGLPAFHRLMHRVQTDPLSHDRTRTPRAATRFPRSKHTQSLTRHLGLGLRATGTLRTPKMGQLTLEFARPALGRNQALQRTEDRYSGRTSRASEPLRPWPTSNSTRWSSLRT